MRATRALIHLDNLAGNIREAKRLAGEGVKLCIPVKADAYGHGAVQCAMRALQSGADCLGVAAVDEGAELRAAGIRAPILLFSPPAVDEIPHLIHEDLQPFVFDSEMVALLNDQALKQGKTVRVHLKVDTGMGRVGCRPEEALGTAQEIALAKAVLMEGICTHFAVSDSPEDGDAAFTRKQLKVFLETAAGIEKAGVNPGIRHCAASGGLLFYPESRLDMVRPGIITYGYYPGAYLRGAPEMAAKTTAVFTPVMELVSQVSAVRTIRAGETVSYGRTWRAEEDGRIGVIPLGYGDGLRRSLSPGLTVGVNGAPCPIVGRICMDQCMALVKDAKRGDPVTLFGDKKKGAPMDAGDLAEIARTIPYEILCGILKRTPRVYL
ncbi:MAG: alanine racemase [Spirochaetaceae bacterium]|jgi:alanine racemase|nr:alanine racemase [Spirochaetaceae bacterium]